MSAVQQFVDVMCGPGAPDEPSDIARRLAACVIETCGRLGLNDAEIYCGGPIVTMILTGSIAWEAVVIGPDAYQLYPGFFRDDGETLVWANVWVAENYSLAKLTRLLGEELTGAAA
jgi:hypothetical protein